VATTYDEDAGPALVLDQGDSSVYLADMSGDGLSDLVRIRNGEVCYWPNLGYGRFGAKVAMDGAPWFDAPDSFDAKRVRLADVDGSGTADIVYLAARGPSIHFNQSGKGFAAGITLHDFPAVDDVASLVTLDLLGAGTTCLVWSSPLPGDSGQQLRYVDLMGGVKPHLLVGIVNNTGAETALSYATSTRFYLQDRLAGRPWATRLAFPVHVVARQEVRERITGTRLVSGYSYHHGYFDGVEREFRGFGMVEQVDAEAVPAASGAGTFSSTPSVAGAEFALPPVRTRTWFHTGAYVGGEDIAAVLSRDYFAGDAQAAHLQATRFDGVTTPEEMREACRALRGRVLRTEVYADDGTPHAGVPYAVTQHRYQVHLLQAPATVSYGSVHACDLETLSYHYERSVADPRVSHQLVLDVDAYGTVTRSASAGYARRAAGAVTEQDATPVTYTEHDVTNVVDQPDWYRLGVPVEVRTYELTGLGAHTDAALLDPDTLHGQAVAAATISVEVTPGAGIQKRLIGRTRTVYRADDLSGPLPLMTIGSLALLDRSYTLAMTAGLATNIYAAKTATAAALATSQGGYVDLDGDGSWWAPSPRLIYSADPAHPDVAFARQHFLLPQGHVDCFGNVSRIAWEHDLVAVRSTDPVGNVTSASVNYRVMQPWLLTDANLNRNGVRVDALGMVVATAQMGKALMGGADEGDHLDLTTPEPSAGDDPTTRLEYGLDAYRTWAADAAHDPDRPTPVFVHTQARVRHKDAATPWLETYAYSDGLGRLVLTKAQAEPGDAPVVVAGMLTLLHTDSRWVGTGRVVNDNKANPVKAYEPFFDTTPAYTAEPLLVLTGVTAITRYDPLSRPVRVDKPNGTFTSVEFDPWRQLASDENDTVPDSEWYTARIGGGLGADQQDAATKAAAHAHTPLVSDVDTLGRVCHTVADGVAGQFSTHTVLDIQGRVLSTVDALDRTVMSTDYDVTGATVHTSSVDAGERWTLLDATGKPLRTWDSRGHEARHTYDAARRPLGVDVSDGGGPLRLVESALYGEGQPGDVAANLRGAVYQQRDGAGLLTNVHRDFKGNLLEVRRRLRDDVRADVDWSGASPLAPETFTTATTYDALNRTVTVTTPDGSVITHSYNQRSLLDGVTVTLHGAGAATAYVNAVAYDARAQRQSIAYGNGAVSTFAYDPQTFRLVHLVTTRPAGGSPVQDLTYTHDPVGNVTRVADAAQSTVFFANQLVAPTGDYTYDTIYRLTRAAGREHIGQSASAPATWDDGDRRAVPLPTDPQAMRNYTEAYTYDRVGNIATVVHTNGGGGWTRSYSYDTPNVPPHDNRLSSTTIGATTELYAHDAAGNMVSMPHLSLLSWDFKDQLQTTSRQVVAGGDPRTSWYRYDAGGGRVRKATVTAAGGVAHERIYQGDYEVYREYSPLHAVTLERQTLIVRGPGGMLAVVETTTVDTAQPGAAPVVTTRYQHGNHAGSACVELDENAAVITYEEYYPFGATSFQAGRSAAEVSLKRYRFAGRERDEESALGCHGARYYAAWIGRWTSADPAGLVDGAGLYTYCRDNPVILHDPTGTQGTTGDHDSDGPPPFHLEPAPQPADGRPAPSIRAVIDRPVFSYRLQLPTYTPPPPPPVVAPADPQPINPIQVYQPAPTSDFRFGNASVAAGGSTLGVGSSLLAFAFAYGLPKAGPFSFEAVLGVTGTGDSTGNLTAGSVSGGGHASLNTEDSRHNFTAYLTFAQTFGQSPPWATTPRNLGGALTLGYEYHAGGPSNDYPRVALGANVSGAAGEFASVSPASTTTGPTATLAPALSAGVVGNVTVNLGYYSQPGTAYGISKVPAVSLLAEGFYNVASGGGALTPPGSTAGPTGSTSSGGFNIGGLYNRRLDGGRSVLSVGATFGPRFQTDSVGPLRFPSSGVFVGGVVGAAF
jgi:RHS repeat-associated protein